MAVPLFEQYVNFQTNYGTMVRTMSTLPSENVQTDTEQGRHRSTNRPIIRKKSQDTPQLGTTRSIESAVLGSVETARSTFGVTSPEAQLIKPSPGGTGGTVSQSQQNPTPKQSSVRNTMSTPATDLLTSQATMSSLHPEKRTRTGNLHTDYQSSQKFEDLPSSMTQNTN